MNTLDMHRLAELLETFEQVAGDRPVHLRRDGRDMAIILSPSRYAELVGSGTSAAGEPLVFPVREDDNRRDRLEEARARLDREG